jgi:mannose-6-phosphate isomerase-like protein (cupin superfamily)
MESLTRGTVTFMQSLYALLFFAVWLAGCVNGAAGALLSPAGRAPGAASNSEAPMLLVRSDAAASHHLLRVDGDGQPLTFADREVTLFVMNGRMRLGLDRGEFQVARGDVVEVPKGTQLRLRNAAAEPGRVYLIVTPPAPDAELAKLGATSAEPRQSAWGWTRW